MRPAGTLYLDLFICPNCSITPFFSLFAHEQPNIHQPTMGHGPLVMLFTLALALVAPATAKPGRQLQGGTTGTCISLSKVSRGQDVESLQVVSGCGDFLLVAA